MTATHAFAVLEVSRDAYNQIASKLREARYDHAFVDEYIDMRGIALVCDDPGLKNNPLVDVGRKLEAAYAALDAISGLSADQAIIEMAQDALAKRNQERAVSATVSVFPDWMATLPMQQQSVLVLAARGPDGARKHHPCKDVVRAYRACVLKAAYYGRDMALGESADHFMSMDMIAYRSTWGRAVKSFFDSVDELPHHYYLHLAHGAEILGYKHPDPVIRVRWKFFYDKCCDDMHVTPETEEEMDRRLGDWGRRHWGEPPHPSLPSSEAEQ